MRREDERTVEAVEHRAIQSATRRFRRGECRTNRRCGRRARRRARTASTRPLPATRRIRAARTRDRRPRALPGRRRRPGAAVHGAEGIALIVVGVLAVVLGAIPSCGIPRSCRSRSWPSRRFAFPSTRRRGGVSPSAALPRARRVGARAGVPAVRGEQPGASALPARASARGLRYVLGDLVPVDVGRAGRGHLPRVLRLPLHRGARRRRTGPLASWLPRALVLTLVALGSLFAAIGIWQAHTRTLFFARDVEVANAYTTFFRVTSLFKDPSLYGRYLVVPIVVLLVGPAPRVAGRSTGSRLPPPSHSSFAGLFYSYSQSSFVALFVVTFAVALARAGRRPESCSIACALVATLAAAAVAADAVERAIGEGRDERPLASRQRHARRLSRPSHRGRRDRRPAARERGESGKGIPKPKRLPHDAADGARGARSASGFALYAWLLAAAAWASGSSPGRTGPSASGWRRCSSSLSCTRSSTQVSSRIR